VLSRIPPGHSALLKLSLDYTGVFIIRRLRNDNKFSAAGEKFRAKYVLSSLKDWKTWMASECSWLGTFHHFVNLYHSGDTRGFVSTTPLIFWHRMTLPLQAMVRYMHSHFSPHPSSRS
jgi:hypothetical protein